MNVSLQYRLKHIALSSIMDVVIENVILYFVVTLEGFLVNRGYCCVDGIEVRIFVILDQELHPL